MPLRVREAVRGYAYDLEPHFSDWPAYGSPVVGLVASPPYPPEAIRRTLRDGRSKADPDTLWVTRQSTLVDPAARAKHGDSVILDYLLSWTENVLVLPVNKPYWGLLSGQGSDSRDDDMIRGCSRVIVFHLPNNNRTAYFIRHQRFYPHITVLEEK